jgi:hypothetical protein
MHLLGQFVFLIPQVFDEVHMRLNVNLRSMDGAGEMGKERQFPRED